MLQFLKAQYVLLSLKGRLTLIAYLLSVLLTQSTVAAANTDAHKVFTINTWISEDLSAGSVQSTDSPSASNSSSEGVIQFLLNTANSSSAASSSSSTSLQSSDSLVYKYKNNNKEDRHDLDEARSELLRILQNRANVQEDLGTHEPVQTIPEAKFRSALDEILKRQFSESEPVSGDNGAGRYNEPPSTRPSPALSSQLVCQFFVFGTLFGVVCSISTCTWCLKPNSEGASSPVSEVNPSNVPAPIDYSKPYMIKCDSRGSCYASPLNDDEVPPLPSYADALECPREPTSASNHLRSSNNTTNNNSDVA